MKNQQIVKAEPKQIAVKKQFDLNSPEQMTQLATVLKNHIVKHNLYTNIKGRNYAHVEGWQFAGGMLGLFPAVTEVKDVSKTGEMKWQAGVDIVNIKTGQVISKGFALCSSKEILNTKRGKFTRWDDEYAVLSMAQTRAIGKAYRNMLGWVMKLAGYEGTPSEEMLKVGETPAQPEPRVEQKDDFRGWIDCQNNCGALVSPSAVEYYKKHKAKKILCKDCVRKK